jgi:hypothetical protein
VSCRSIATGLLCLIAARAVAQADHTDFDRDLLVLKPDKQLEVRILRVTDKQLVYLQGSRETTVATAQVASFERSLDLAAPFLRSCQEAVDKRDVEALVTLARWCGTKRLRKFARDAWLEVLLLQPQTLRTSANKPRSWTSRSVRPASVTRHVTVPHSGSVRCTASPGGSEVSTFALTRSMPGASTRTMRGPRSLSANVSRISWPWSSVEPMRRR